MKNKISTRKITRFCKQKKNNRWRPAHSSFSFIICHLHLVESQQNVIYTFFYCFSSGNGGDAGRINFRARHINGEVTLSVCRGHGAEAALNGRAGPVKLAGTFGNKELKQNRF